MNKLAAEIKAEALTMKDTIDDWNAGEEEEFTKNRLEDASDLLTELADVMDYIDHPETWSQRFEKQKRTWKTKDEEIAELKEKVAQFENMYTNVQKEFDKQTNEYNEMFFAKYNLERSCKELESKLDRDIEIMKEINKWQRETA